MVTPQIINLLVFKVNVNERNDNLSIGSIQQIDSFVSTKKIMLLAINSEIY
ncbi:hypothetical protein [Tepidibacillus fermentans]|uniref:hypothetical protein n=1 Tax=Tepidibacillus fermentans TaxID=1281767 RepID=UPI0014053104|nr:hypothetical protein [Tepidibacillus fermentans]